MIVETHTFAEWLDLDPALIEHQGAFQSTHGTSAEQYMDLATFNMRIADAGIDYVVVPPVPPTTEPPEPPVPVPPTMLTPPAAEQQGGLLICTAGTWDGEPTSYAYQWKKDGVDIGTGASEYTIVDPDDVGATFICTVTATNADGSTPATSNAVVAVTPVA